MRTLLLLNLIAFTVTAIAVIVVTYARRRNLAWLMHESSLISKAAAIPALKSVMPEFEKEISRARRCHRPLTVAVLDVDDEELMAGIAMLFGANGPAASAPPRQAVQTVRIVYLLIGAILRDAVRESDVIAYDAQEDDFVILLPDSSRAQAAAALERMRQLLRDRTMAVSRVGFAEFPKEALTVEDLIAAARTSATPALSPAPAPVEAAA